MSPWSTLCVTASLCLLLSASVIAHHKEYEPERTSVDVSYQATAPQKHAHHPPEVPLEVDGYPVAPHGLSLEQVHVFVRHGERAPLSVCLSRGPAPIPQHWILCKDAQRFRGGTRVPAVVDHGFPSGRILVERADGSVTKGECFLGELTDIGRQTSHDLGRSLRKLYVDRLSFLPSTLNHNQVYFRSTNIARTIETLQHVIYGLYPAHKRDSDIVPDILIRSGQDENLLPNFFCERLKILRSRFAQAAAKAFNPTLEPFDHKLSWHNDGRPVRLDGNPSASDILGTVRAAIANGVNVPPEFKDKTIVDVIERAVANHSFAGYETDEVRKLAMGPLLGDVTRKMLPKIDMGAKDRIKIFIYATHDVTLAGLLATLDIFDEKLPAFTAFITLELFKKHEQAVATSSNISSQSLLSTFKSQPATEYFIRLRYKNKDLALPFCSQEGKHLLGHPEFCSFSVFLDRAKELTPVNHSKECSISVDS